MLEPKRADLLKRGASSFNLFVIWWKICGLAITGMANPKNLRLRDLRINHKNLQICQNMHKNLWTCDWQTKNQICLPNFGNIRDKAKIYN
jgi:hypothetical protein